jgi:hypothetical protein
MKNLIKVKAVLRTAGIAALVAAIGFTIIACDNGGGGGGGGTPSAPTSATYTSYDDAGTEYKLVITKAAGRAAYDPKEGDDYTLTIKFVDGTLKISTGTVAGVTSVTIELQPKDGETTVTVTVSSSGNTIVSFSADIPVDNGEPVQKPEETLTPNKPGTPNTPSGGKTSVQNANVYLENGALLSGINADVFLELEGEGNVEIKIGSITNGKLSFTLPDDISNDAAYGWEQIAERYSYKVGETTPWDDIVTKNSVVVSQKDAKWLDSGFYCTTHEGNGYALSYSATEEEGTEINGGYIYLDKSTTLKGDWTMTWSDQSDTWIYNQTFDCTFTAGWNILYWINTEETDENTTHTETQTVFTTPPAASMKWVASGWWHGQSAVGD